MRRVGARRLHGSLGLALPRDNGRPDGSTRRRGRLRWRGLPLAVIGFIGGGHRRVGRANHRFRRIRSALGAELGFTGGKGLEIFGCDDPRGARIEPRFGLRAVGRRRSCVGLIWEPRSAVAAELPTGFPATVWTPHRTFPSTPLLPSSCRRRSPRCQCAAERHEAVAHKEESKAGASDRLQAPEIQ